MLTGMELMTCPNLAVPAAIMRHLIDVESGYNPYAIGVVNGQLVRQPQSLGEAVATVQMLESKGYNFSVGVSQVNRSNLVKYGLDSYEKAFNPCLNLSVGSRILAECYGSAGGDWGKAFSCYYSGNFVTGFRDGYVQKIYASMGQSLKVGDDAIPADAIPLKQFSSQPVTAMRSETITMPVATPDSAAYRLAIRSVALDTAATTAVAQVASAIAASAQAPAPAAQAAATPAAAAPAQTTPVAQAAPHPAPSTNQPAATASDVFVPQVSGPSDPRPGAVAAVHNTATPSQALSSNASPAGDSADLRQGVKDDAFVF